MAQYLVTICLEHSLKQRLHNLLTENVRTKVSWTSFCTLLEQVYVGFDAYNAMLQLNHSHKLSDRRMKQSRLF